MFKLPYSVDQIMTFVMGVNFGKYVLFCADTRTTYYNWDGSVHHYDDESQKIQKTNIGLITGAGYGPLLNAVKKRLFREECANTDDILKIIREERQRYLLQSYNSPLARPIEFTSWILSYITTIKNAPKLRLAIYHPSIVDDLGLYQNNESAIIPPYECTKREAKIISDLITELIKPIEKFSKLEDSIQYHFLVFTKIVKRIQPKYHSISSYCQLGVHTIDGLAGISSILHKNEKEVSLTLTS